MKTLNTTLILFFACAFCSRAQQVESAVIATPVAHFVSASSKSTSEPGPASAKENARMAIPELIRGLFSTKLNERSAIITVDAGWRDDSLSIEYKYYRINDDAANSEAIPGSNLDGQLVEKIYFTFLPIDITSFKTENDEMMFLYLGTGKHSAAVRKLVSGTGGRSSEVNSVRSFGFPVQAAKLEELKKQLKELR